MKSLGVFLKNPTWAGRPSVMARAVLGGNRRGGSERENGDQAAMNTSRPEKSQSEMACRRALSLTPCFSWVFLVREEAVTVSTVSTARQTVETVHRAIDLLHTQLKQGANESRCSGNGHAKNLKMNPDEKQFSRSGAG